MDRTLNDLAVGERAAVTRLTAQGDMRGRLLDIGLTCGACVRCLFAAPSGEPRAYLIRGAVIALRAEDADTVCVRKERATWG